LALLADRSSPDPGKNGRRRRRFYDPA